VSLEGWGEKGFGSLEKKAFGSLEGKVPRKEGKVKGRGVSHLVWEKIFKGGDGIAYN